MMLTLQIHYMYMSQKCGMDAVATTHMSVVTLNFDLEWVFGVGVGVADGDNDKHAIW